MAQAGYTPISLYYSTTAAAVPTAGNLVAGELAINIVDGKLYYENSSGVVTLLAGAGGAGIVAGSNTQLQFNNSGVFGASANLTWNGTSLSATQIDITAQGPLRLQDTTGGEYVGLRSPASLGASYTLTFPADDGTSGQALITDGSGVLSWSTAASGDVYGPGSSTDNAVARFDSTTGKLLQNSVVIIDDTGNVSGVGTLSASGDTTVSAGTLAVTKSTTGDLVTFSNTNAAVTNGSTILKLAAEDGAGVANFYLIRAYAGPIATPTEAFNVAGSGAINAGINNSIPHTLTGSLTVTAGATIYGITVGRGAGNLDTNTVVGASAFATNSTGLNNVAVGRSAGLTNNGSANTFIGDSSGYWNSTGSNNVGVGFASYAANTTAATGSNNTAVGRESLYNNTSASYNTAVGYQAGFSNTTGGQNSYVGMYAGYYNQTGSNNTALGYGAFSSSGSTGSGSNNTAVGREALSFTITGSGNTAVGYQAGYNTTGNDNTALGYVAGKTITTGVYNIVVGPNSMDNSAGVTGDDNVAVGRISMRLLTSGDNNTALGNGALGSISTANNNVAVGYSALNVSTASNNTAVGYQAGVSNSSGSENVFIGLQSAYWNTTGSNNTSLGYGAFSSNNGTANGTGSYNVAIGRDALAVSTTGANNTAVGYEAARNTTTDTATVAIGHSALYNNTNGGGGSYNIAIGQSASYFGSTGAYYNIAIGAYAMYGQSNAKTAAFNTAIGNPITPLATGAYTMGEITSGTYNTALGNAALGFLTSGSYNTALGVSALRSNTTASGNVAVGYQAGYYNTSANVTYVGYRAGANTTGTLNAFFGNDSGINVTTGAKNTIIGSFNGNQGGLDIRTASNRIVLSDGDGNPRGVFDNNGNFMVGAVAKETQGCTLYGTGANGFYFASTGTTGYFITNLGLGTGAGTICTIYNDATVAGSIAVSGANTAYNTSSDYRLKENIAPMTGALAKVAQLKPVTYTWKLDGSDGQGFIAHELQEVCPDAVVGEKDALDEKGNIKPQGIDTSYLVATLTAAIQEQQAIIESLKARLDAANL